MTAAYFDWAATTQVEQRVAEIALNYMVNDFGNSGSRTHAIGTTARSATEVARKQVADVVGADVDDVIFTSGATEADNLAILGLREHAIKRGLNHIITSSAEHKAVLEPIQHLEAQGFRVTYLKPNEDGLISAQDVSSSLTEKTFLVSIMQVNNETGILQPINEIGRCLENHSAYFHVDAAQGFGKSLEDLLDKRIDLISASGHKLYAPKGVGALIMRKRNGRERVPLEPLMFGGGQEKKIRPGTLPVALIAAFGLACELAQTENSERAKKCREIEELVTNFVLTAGGEINGSRANSVPNILNASFPGIDSEAFILATKEVIAISNGSACTSSSYEKSHVLQAMGLAEKRLDSAIRFSWSHFADLPDFDELLAALQSVRI
jgi:cysteine desulfurase